VHGTYQRRSSALWESFFRPTLSYYKLYRDENCFEATVGLFLVGDMRWRCKHNVWLSLSTTFENNIRKCKYRVVIEVNVLFTIYYISLFREKLGLLTKTYVIVNAMKMFLLLLKTNKILHALIIRNFPYS
jgi:hypothetical protein